MRKKLLLLALCLLVVLVGAFVWWAFSPLLFDREVHDELDPALATQLDALRQTGENGAAGQGTEAGGEDVMLRGPFPIVDTPTHPASGEIELIQSAEETLVRYVDYNGTNGPDLYVYLSKDLTADEHINLGPARGNKGTIIYNVPSDVDVREYSYILTWCRAFGVLFDYAVIDFDE